MPRPQNKIPSETIRVTVPPKVLRYLEDLVLEEVYGPTVSAVANQLIVRQIDEFISQDRLKRRKGPSVEPRSRKSDQPTAKEVLPPESGE